MNPVEFIKKEYGVLKQHPYHFAMTALIAGGIGFAAADYHYSGRIESLKETLETKEFPKPIVQTRYVPVPDHSQADQFKTLGEKLDAIINLLGKPRFVTPSAHSRPAIGSHTETTASQSGVAMGSGGHIDTVNQNALPARSAFAVPLGKFYTEGFLIQQKASFLGLKDDQVQAIASDFDKWRQKVVDWMNANMCSDAAAYFLKAHRTSISFNGVGPMQNNLLDIASWTLDNLSDIKRNDAWDCK